MNTENNPDEKDLIEDIMRDLGLCGCGHPEDAARYLADVLRHIDRLKYEVWEEKLTYDEWMEAGKSLFVNGGAECFTYYFLDNLDLIEHGGSVPGWLTEKGDQVRAKITRALA